jgi:acyl carrier protein
VNTTSAYDAVSAAIRQVAPEADLTRVDGAEGLRAALDLDSLDFLSVVEHVAASTGVTVPESDYLAVDSLDAFVAYLTERMV